jgi:monoamine oxidase
MSEEKAPYTRRQFLSDVGRLGGYGAMYGTMGALGLLATPANAKPVDFKPLRPEGRRSRKEILILGAGIAGLATAYEMSKAGYRCTILEARERPGGRNWTVRGGTRETELNGYKQVCRFDRDQYMNAGPARIPQHHVTLDYCRELGVPIEVFTNANADAYFYYEDRGPLSETPIRHRTAKADIFGYTSELLSKATNQGALDDSLSGNDKERLIEYLRQFGALGGGGTYSGSSRRGYLTPPGAGDQTGIVDLPPYGLSELLQSRIGEYFDFEFGWDQAMLMYQPVGGMDRIPYALEEAVRKLGTQIIYDAEVQQIWNTPKGVEVSFVKRSKIARMIAADFCVCTIPLQVLKNIPSNFSPEFQAALEVPIPVSTGKIGLQYSRRFWEEDEKILGGITATNVGDRDGLGLNTIWYPSYGYLGKKGVVVGYYNFGGTADNYADLSPSNREYRALMEGAKIHGPSYIDELENAFSVSWRNVRYSEGGWVGWPSSSGQRVPAYSLLNQPDGNVYLAGDGLSYYIAWQAGAFESARKVSMDIHKRVMAAA